MRPSQSASSVGGASRVRVAYLSPLYQGASECFTSVPTVISVLVFTAQAAQETIGFNLFFRLEVALECVACFRVLFHLI